MSFSPSASLPRQGHLSAGTHRMEASKVWLRVLLVLHCALLIPYITDLVPAFYGIGLFPIRPAYFMLALCLLNGAWIVFKGPDLTKTALFLICLLCFRAFDIGILGRYSYPDGQKIPFFTSSSVVVMASIMALSLSAIRKTRLLPILVVAAGSILIQVASILMEFSGLIRMSTVDGRAAGLAGDANDSCMMLTLMLTVFLSLNRRFWLNLGLIAVTGIGILPTLSRGGMLVLTLIIALFVLLNLRRHAGKLILTGLAAIPVLTLMLGLLVSNTSKGGVVDVNAKKRIEGIFGGSVGEMGSSERMKDLQDGIQGALLKPLAGHGTGAGEYAYQPHNQLVSLWIELGLFGPFLLLVLLGIASVKVIASRGRCIYILIPLFLYLGLAQTLLENMAYIYALLVLLYFTSRRFFTFRLTRPRSSA